MPKMTALEKQAMLDQVAKERSKKDLSGSTDRVFSAGQQALDEQRRESRFTSPELEERGRDAYSDPYTKVIAKKKGGSIKSSASKRADGIATKGFTKGRYL